MSFGYHFQAPSSSGVRSRRNPHRPSSSSLKSFQMVRPREELTDSPTVPTFVEKFEAGRSFDVEDDFAFIPELCTEEERLTPIITSTAPSAAFSSLPTCIELYHVPYEHAEIPGSSAIAATQRHPYR
ncbi:hypothetical protein FN846DRAFT_355242 [Sphaerosporella brunnea]|uniref:Uncharacterized protein n=1 Tax=Sphaerosporella brunnea TaxID=1250544 RepID=A0A5J5EH93_9PEZI|nr:hypothetical protein FN846DRAFT_355242 [Sphaerosporella brunnea]